jgi:hypothetical protein
LGGDMNFYSVKQIKLGIGYDTQQDLILKLPF